MKTLYLIRHAKSSWTDHDLPDFERPLNERGKHDAPMMGERLAVRGVKPDIILASTAKRAMKTAKIIAKEIGYKKDKIQASRELYLAETKNILSAIAGIDDAMDSAMLFGHNPGFTDVANYLSDLKIDNMPTCSILCVAFEVNSWKDVPQKQGKYKFFDYPKKTV